MVKLVFWNAEINQAFVIKLFSPPNFRVKVVLPRNSRKNFPGARHL